MTFPLNTRVKVQSSNFEFSAINKTYTCHFPINLNLSAHVTDGA